MRAARLLRLFPRAWRERYGDEFLALVGDGPLGTRQIVNVISAAIDARLSPDVRKLAGATSRAGISQGDTVMTATLRRACARPSPPLTTRDGLIGAAVIVGGTFALLAAGRMAGGLGYHGANEFLKGLAFPVSALVSNGFTFLKGQPWKAQAVIIGGGLVILAACGVVAMYV
jgi:hypothetical protein